MHTRAIVTVVTGAGIVAAPFVLAYIFPCIAMGHRISWTGSDRNFHQDIGECRAASLSSSVFGGAVVDESTFRYLMKGRGWEAHCRECGEVQ